MVSGRRAGNIHDMMRWGLRDFMTEIIMMNDKNNHQGSENKGIKYLLIIRRGGSKKMSTSKRIQWANWIWSQWDPSYSVERILNPQHSTLKGHRGTILWRVVWKATREERVPARVGKWSLQGQAKKGLIHFMWVNTRVPRGSFIYSFFLLDEAHLFYISNLRAVPAHIACVIIKHLSASHH